MRPYICEVRIIMQPEDGCRGDRDDETAELTPSLMPKSLNDKKMSDSIQHTHYIVIVHILNEVSATLCTPPQRKILEDKTNISLISLNISECFFEEVFNGL